MIYNISYALFGQVLLLFEAAWGQDRQLNSYPICWLSSVGDMVLDQVKTRSLAYEENEIKRRVSLRFYMTNAIIIILIYIYIVI